MCALFLYYSFSSDVFILYIVINKYVDSTVLTLVFLRMNEPFIFIIITLLLLTNARDRGLEEIK